MNKNLIVLAMKKYVNKHNLITTFVFFRYAIVIASIIVYVNYPVKTRSYNV